MLAGLHRLDDHLGMQVGRGADVDDIELAVGDQLGKAAIGARDAVLLGKLDDVIAARRDRLHLDIDAIDAPIRIHMQLGYEAAAGQSNPDFLHCVLYSMTSSARASSVGEMQVRAPARLQRNDSG